MTLQKISLTTAHLTLWLDDDQGLVFDHGQKSLFLLAPISLALLFSLDNGDSEQQAITAVTAHGNLSSEQIQPFLQQVRELLNYSESSRSYADGKYPELQPHKIQNVSNDVFVVEIAHSSFAIRCVDNSLANAIQTQLAPIAMTSSSVSVGKLNVDFDFSIVKEDKNSNGEFNYAIYSNGLQVEYPLAVNQVMPVLIDRLQILAYQQSAYCFGFHGAALLSDKGRILLPGVSGAGKSTLTAELSKHDYRVYSDEIIALDEQFQLTSLPLPMAIKSGSWDFIDKLYPQIQQQPEWLRIDGRRLKYIWPENIAPQPEKPSTDKEQSTTATKTLLVSPNYQSGSQASVKKLSVIDTIALVTNGGYQVGFELNEAKVEQLLQFCQQISAYQITYSSSAQALELVADLWQS